MNDIAIHVENLGKRFRIGGNDARLLKWFARSREQEGRSPKTSNTWIWALKNVSLDVHKGEVVGLIGSNGAGKSTLLKILARIIEPTEGYAEIKGRVGSLLEVGTGFHSDLSGRDNVYLSGAMLGMKKAEIDRKFSEIVAFAELEEFIETPVRHYSSGMYMRLAFAVAAFLECEILLVDEVLAVGDRAFQKKCIGRIDDVTKEGRTVLFVSHNMSVVQRLCRTAFLIDHGKVIFSGESPSVVNEYIRLTQDSDGATREKARMVPEGTVKYIDYKILGSKTGSAFSCYSGESIIFQLQLAAKRTVKQANFGIVLWSEDGTLVWAMRNLDYGGSPVALAEGTYILEYRIPAFPVRPGSYQLHVSANDLTEGTLDEWYARPLVEVLIAEESGLPPVWQGVLNIKGEFQLIESSQRTNDEF